MFVFRLVSGVRSSCEASATSCRCARLEPSSAASIVLKLVASRPSSSSPVEVDSIRCERSRVSVTASVVSVSRRTGASAARETIRPSAAATPIPPTAIRIRKSVIRCSVRFTSPSGLAIWTAYGVAGMVRTRNSIPWKWRLL